jgi:hypothetical protein
VVLLMNRVNFLLHLLDLLFSIVYGHLHQGLLLSRLSVLECLIFQNCTFWLTSIGKATKLLDLLSALFDVFRIFALESFILL